jgi:hypothetical protein
MWLTSKSKAAFTESFLLFFARFINVSTFCLFTEKADNSNQSVIAITLILTVKI